MKKFLFAIAAMALLFSCNPDDKNEPNNPTTPTEPEEPGEIVEDWSGLTDPQNRKVVIEEYTGINCTFCPDGHKIVNEIVAANPGNVFAINIHTGSYAANTYTTTEGAKYASEASIGGYPAGCINRHAFPSYSQDENGGMAMGRGYFKNATKQMLKKTSPVNIKAYAYIETATRTLTVKIKGYYTATPTDSAGAALDTNYLYVMLLQDSVLGTQTGASKNPDQVIGGQYCHMHMLRGSLNGTWGDPISPVTAGSWIEKEITYVIPETIGKDKVEAVLEHMKVVVFVAEGHKEIYTAYEPETILK